MQKLKYPHLFSPITLGKTVFRNRIAASATSYMNGDHSNLITKEMIEYFELKAMGGVSSVTMGDCLVDSKNGRASNVSFPLDNLDQKGNLSTLAKSINRHGSVSVIQINHCGMHSHISGQQLGYMWGPSGLMMPKESVIGTDGQIEESFIEVKEMSEEMIEYTISRFGDGALYAKQCGFGMIQLHGGHGWLVAQFMSNKSNKRKDRWGGSLENRMRFPLAIIEDIRKKCGRDFPIEFRMSGTECTAEGYDLDEGVRFAKILDGKVDLIHVSTGYHEDLGAFFRMAPSMFDKDGCNVKYAEEIKKHVITPVATVGALTDPAMMEEIIASGKADMIELGRQILADPALSIKARSGRSDEITPCLRCFSCFSEIATTNRIECAVNPVIGYEEEAKFDKLPEKKKKVLVAGGGIGGMQAALTCAERGHEVILCDKTDRLGGILLCEERVPFKDKLHLYIEKQKRMIERSSVEVRMNTEVTANLVEEISPDSVIAAIGATPIKPNIPGIDGSNVFGAIEMFKEYEGAGQKVTILGGGLVGVELGILLSMNGREVTILEMMPALSYTGAFMHGLVLNGKIQECGINVELSTRAIEINEKGVVGEDKDGNQKIFESDTIIYATGLRPQYERLNELRQIHVEFAEIGDCISARNIHVANQEAYTAARNIGRF